MQSAEVIYTRFGVVEIASVAERIVLAQCAGHGAGGGQRIVPSIVGVGYHLRTAGVDKAGHISLCVLQVEVRPAVGQRCGTGNDADNLRHSLMRPGFSVSEFQTVEFTTDSLR